MRLRTVASLASLAATLVAVIASAQSSALDLTQRARIDGDKLIVCSRLSARQAAVIERNMVGPTFVTFDDPDGGDVWRTEGAEPPFPAFEHAPPAPPPPPGPGSQVDARFKLLSAGQSEQLCQTYPLSAFASPTLTVQSSYEPVLRADSPSSTWLDRQLAAGVLGPMRDGQVLTSNLCHVDVRARTVNCG